ncbi:MAG: sensor histidine kinase [Sphingobacteriia bacterium]|nr:MAG: sensor histidine kinase [Sphingobacteriia bacterium]
MIGHLFNWKTILFIIAIFIVSGTIVYSQYVAKQIAIKERKNVEAWVEAERTILNSDNVSNINLASKISSENKEIPIIETDEKDNPTGNFINLDTAFIQSDSTYLKKKLAEFIAFNKEPIILVLNQNPYTINKYYYGESKLLKEVKWYPFVQLLVVALFVLIAFIALQTQYKSSQNQLWASMAKETAHQLGTPVSSLEGWLEILKEKKETATIVPEIAKDIDRLQLITDRFGKIGSTPSLHPQPPVIRVLQVVNYMKKRSSEQIVFTVDHDHLEQLEINLSPTLFEWVFENLIKNALDAMDGQGAIHINFKRQENDLVILVTDTGKGIPSNQIKHVFKAGYTTKKRGWGIGLSLSKRIIEQYHNGKLFVKWSDPSKGTCFSIILPIPSSQDQA